MTLVLSGLHHHHKNSLGARISLCEPSLKRNAEKTSIDLFSTSERGQYRNLDLVDLWDKVKANRLDKSTGGFDNDVDIASIDVFSKSNFYLGRV